jgi:chemotaxis protein methyltransferase CheR
MMTLQGLTFDTSHGEFLRLRDYIRERSDVVLPDSRLPLIRDWLVNRMAELGLDDMEEYYYQVKYDESDCEFHRFLALLTAGGGGFFRRDPQLTCFADELLPHLIRQREGQPGKKKLRIWSAGCSTGEEPYTLAMLAQEKLAKETDWTVEVLASDLSRSAITTGSEGVYLVRELTEVSRERCERFFDIKGEWAAVKPEITAMVRFFQMNLNRPDELAGVKNVDVVFCRNVLSYFPEAIRREVARGFYDSFEPGGYLFIGHTETLHGVSKAYRLVYFKNALVYQKDGLPGDNRANSLLRASSGLVESGSSRFMVGAADGANAVLELLSLVAVDGKGSTGKSA